MKFVKFGALALALGMFAASCNEESSEVTTNTDTAVVVAPVAETPVMVTPVDTAVMTTDTAVVVPAN